ncbi:hypothetical protein ACJX0J_035748 [Zea mays]
MRILLEKIVQAFKGVLAYAVSILESSKQRKKESGLKCDSMLIMNIAARTIKRSPGSRERERERENGIKYILYHGHSYVSKVVTFSASQSSEIDPLASFLYDTNK